MRSLKVPERSEHLGLSDESKAFLSLPVMLPLDKSIELQLFVDFFLISMSQEDNLVNSHEMGAGDFGVWCFEIAFTEEVVFLSGVFSSKIHQTRRGC